MLRKLHPIVLLAMALVHACLFAPAAKALDTRSGAPSDITDPSEDPTDDPQDDPSDDPTLDPGDDPVDDPSDDPAQDPVAFSIDDLIQVIDSNCAVGTVAFEECSKFLTTVPRLLAVTKRLDLTTADDEEGIADEAEVALTDLEESGEGGDFEVDPYLVFNPLLLSDLVPELNDATSPEKAAWLDLFKLLLANLDLYQQVGAIDPAILTTYEDENGQSFKDSLLAWKKSFTPKEKAKNKKLKDHGTKKLKNPKSPKSDSHKKVPSKKVKDPKKNKNKGRK